MKEVTVMTTKADAIKNKQLAKTTSMIKDIEVKTKKSMWKIAALLRNVRDKELYKEDGFKNTAEYAEVILGYKKSTVSNMITISERFMSESGALLPMFGDSEYSLSQLQEMLPIKNEDIPRLITENSITEESTVSSIRKAVNGTPEKAKVKKKVHNTEPKTESNPEPAQDDIQEKLDFIHEKAKQLQELANLIINNINGEITDSAIKNDSVLAVQQMCTIFAETVNALK